MIYLLCAFDFRGIVGEVLVYSEIEVESPTLVHALVWLNSERKVEDVVRVGERSFHGAAERALELCEVWEGEVD